MIASGIESGRIIRAVCAVACGLLVHVTTAMAQVTPPPTDWVSAEGRDHPLAGTIWSTAKNAAVPYSDLAEQMIASRIVVFGEIHVNADHHRLQAWAVETLASARRAAGRSGPAQPALAMEHIRADKQSTLDQFLTSDDRKAGNAADLLLDRLEWEKSGWPSREMFRPIFSEALTAQLPIRAGDPERDVIRGVARGIARSVDTETTQRLQLAFELPTPLQDALLDELEASHCGLMQRSSLGNIAIAQRFRDAHLADATLSGMEKSGSALLLTGNGHVRSDRAVPWHLRRRAPDAALMTVVVVEVEPGKTDAAAYVPKDPDGKAAADYVWFTPRAERPDSCAEMRKQFESRKKAQ